MSKIKGTLSIFLSLILVISTLPYMSLSSFALTDGDFEYQILDDGTVEITRYIGTDTAVSIPSEIDGNTVTSIGYEAFYECTSLESVEIPCGVTVIGDYAFNSCTSLESITIPNGVTSIGFGAFMLCMSLAGVDISNTVTNIGDLAFAYCTSLESVTVPDGVVSVGEAAFAVCESLKSVKISASVTNIGECAFGFTLNEDETEMIKVDGFTIYSYSLSTAEIYANDCGFNFISLDINEQYDCNPADYQYELINETEIAITGYTGNSVNIEIPSEIDGYKVTGIGTDAFYECKSITGVMIPTSVTSIDESAFGECTALTDVYYSGTPEMWANIEIYASNEWLTDATIHFNSFSGDVNGDGTIDVADYAMLRSFVTCASALTDEQKIYADVNRDGAVDAMDAIQIDLMLHGII